jgi:hypothetical protein
MINVDFLLDNLTSSSNFDFLQVLKNSNDNGNVSSFDFLDIEDHDSPYHN